MLQFSGRNKILAIFFYGLVLCLAIVFSSARFTSTANAASDTLSWKCAWINTSHIACTTSDKIVDPTNTILPNQFDVYYSPSKSIAANHAVFFNNNGTYVHVNSDGTSVTINENSTSDAQSDATRKGVDLSNGENARVPAEEHNGATRCGLATISGNQQSQKTGISASGNASNSDRNDVNIHCLEPNDTNYDGKQWEGAEKLLQTIASNISCEQNAGALGFVTCPILRMLNDSVGKTIGACDDCKEGQGILVELLTINPLEGDAAVSMSRAWDGLKNIALGLYVVVFLVAIFANSLSIGVDQYTVKRMMPRLVAGAILTQFSWLIVWSMISISNLIGAGIPLIIKQLSPGESFGYTQGFSNAFSATILGATGILFSGLGIILVIILALVVLIALLIAIVTLVARRLIIYILVLAAPIAFVAWILPNTEKLYKAWWSQLLKVLAMYPIATGLISISLLLSQILTSNGAGLFNSLIAVAFPLMALIMLPKTFKWGGSMLAAVSGAVTARAKGVQKAATAPVKKKAGETAKLGKDHITSAAGGFGLTARGRAMSNARANARLKKHYSEGLEDMKDDDLLDLSKKHGSKSAYGQQIEAQLNKRRGTAMSDYASAIRDGRSGSAEYNLKKYQKLTPDANGVESFSSRSLSGVSATGISPEFKTQLERIDSRYNTGSSTQQVATGGGRQAGGGQQPTGNGRQAPTPHTVTPNNNAPVNMGGGTNVPMPPPQAWTPPANNPPPTYTPPPPPFPTPANPQGGQPPQNPGGPPVPPAGP